MPHIRGITVFVNSNYPIPLKTICSLTLYCNFLYLNRTAYLHLVGSLQSMSVTKTSLGPTQNSTLREALVVMLFFCLTLIFIFHQLLCSGETVRLGHTQRTTNNVRIFLGPDNMD
uniref:Uncharacterized protein n=1 Tax=Anser brachyrhynchus TaxID=132585 RepID=A0A8B9B8P4_9AVES